MAEFSAVAVQTVNPGEAIIFTSTPEPCERGFIKHRDETGTFLVNGWLPNQFANGCPCKNKSATYTVKFESNIAIPTGGTAGEISVGIAINGTVIPVSSMVVTPAAVEQYFNVGKEIDVDIWRGCCETISIVNTSTQPILVQAADVKFRRPDLVVTY